MGRRSVLCVGCFFALASAQVLHVTTHLIEVSVVARTKQGEPAAGLSRDDFSLFDDGRPQQIALFRPETSRPAKTVSPPLPPNVFTNRFAGAPTGATAILFDGLNTRLIDQAYARQQLVKFIRQLQPEDRVALYVMGRGPRVLQDFTGDSAMLLKAIAGYKGGAAPSLDAPMYDPALSAPARFDAWLGELTFNLYDYYGTDRAFRTVRALIAIANHLEHLPGRKNLIWVSGSFPVAIGGDTIESPGRLRSVSRDAAPEVERAARAFNKANLAIYPVDARGLIATQEYAGPLTRPELRNPDTSEFAVMRMLAERTGGRAFYNNNDLAGAFRQAADDARITYVLGYYPSHKDWKGKFRKIEVRVNRPDIELQYRNGYFAQPDEPVDAGYRERVLDAAIWDPMDATGLGLTVQLTPKAAGELDVALQIRSSDIAFRHKEGHWECGLDVWLVQLDRKEKQIKTEARVNNLRLDQATFDRVNGAGGLVLMDHLSPAPDAWLLRVMVRDVATGELGSLTVPLSRR
jgi:VWFA-related protein